jgi:antitoxin YefM
MRYSHLDPTSGSNRLASSRLVPRPVSSAAWTSGGVRATIVAMSTQSLRDVRDHLSEVIDRVEQQHDRVVVTRNGVPAAVILSPDDLAQLEETIDVLGDAQALSDIREADAAYARGDVVHGVDAVRALRP